jgi:hypothetical protein
LQLQLAAVEIVQSIATHDDLKERWQLQG